MLPFLISTILPSDHATLHGLQLVFCKNWGNCPEEALPTLSRWVYWLGWAMNLMLIIIQFHPASVSMGLGPIHAMDVGIASAIYRSGGVGYARRLAGWLWRALHATLFRCEH
jgi:hypothetical protein